MTIDELTHKHPIVAGKWRRDRQLDVLVKEKGLKLIRVADVDFTDAESRGKQSKLVDACLRQVRPGQVLFTKTFRDVDSVLSEINETTYVNEDEEESEKLVDGLLR